MTGRDDTASIAEATSGATEHRFARLMADLTTRDLVDRPVVVESPIAIEYNGIGYAVMMATPIDLGDFATGFSLSEGLISRADEIRAVEMFEADQGMILRIELPSAAAAKVMDRARQRVSESSCGLCGMDNLDEVMRPLPQVTAAPMIDTASIFAALKDLRRHQRLGQATGAAHAAAFCRPDGQIVLVREDVGRHNALDKLIGALANSGESASTGFVLLTARCSFELVQKAILANCGTLVTISAATDLAIRMAAQHGLTLISLARPDAVLAPA